MPDPAIAESAPDQPTAPGGRSVIQLLTIFSVALALPIALFAAGLFWQVAAAERTRVENDATDTARSIAFSIDREIAGLTASLDALSLSDALDKGDLDGFYAQAAVLARRQGIVPVLADMTGQQLVNLRLPRDAVLPKSNLPIDATALANGRPFATDLFDGSVAGTHVFGVATGVETAARARYVLSFSLDPDRLRRVLDQAEMPASWIAAIVDRRGIVMARSARQDEFVGKPAARDFLAVANANEGSWSGSTLEGETVFGAYARSRLSGYRVGVAVSRADLNAPLWRSLSLFAALGLVIVCLSVFLALLFGRRISRPMRALARRAAALGRGETVEPLATGLYEANMVGAELASASENRRRREDDLREANEEIQRFAYIVSHDLRSPLVNIMGFTSELEALRTDLFERLAKARAVADAAASAGDDAMLASDFDEAIGFIKASIAKMDRLINAILRLSREGRREFRPERVDMEGLAHSIADSLAHQAGEADATVSIGRLPPVLSDRLALEQIFSNLIDNALKYLRRDVSGRIEVEGRATSAGLVYEVRDNGRGIDTRDRDRVFDLFRRSGVQDRPGEGIGLAHVRALVRRLGGTITLESDLGRGTTFTVTLPRRWARAEQREAA